MRPGAVIVFGALGAWLGVLASSGKKKTAPPSKPKPPATSPAGTGTLVIKPGATYVLSLVVIDDEPQAIVEQLEAAGFSDVIDLRKGSEFPAPKTWTARVVWNPPIGAPAFGARIGSMTVLKAVGPL